MQNIRNNKTTMSLSYCRMRNAARDLRDAVENWDNIDDPDEYRAALTIYKLAQELLDLGEPKEPEE